MPQIDPKVIFHAGFHKTGTTSVQAALHLHSPALAPTFAIQTRTSSPTLLNAAEAARDHSATPSPQTAARLTESLMHWAASLTLTPTQGLLVSCEDFSGHIPGRFGVPDYRAALPITVAIRAALHTHLPRHRLTFLFTTRQPDPWLRAIHWQLSKHDELTQGPVRFARSHAAAADFARLLVALRAQMPDTPVLEADLASLATRHLGPIEALYDAANLPQALRDSLLQPPHANRSPPHDLARVFVKLNRSDLPRPEIRRLKRDMLAAETLLLAEDDPRAPKSRHPT
jgi:hypothetical protein